jgi:hypothetical protein
MDRQLEKYLPIFRQQLDKWVIFNEEEWAILAQQLTFRPLLEKGAPYPSFREVG